MGEFVWKMGERDGVFKGEVVGDQEGEVVGDQEGEVEGEVEGTADGAPVIGQASMTERPFPRLMQKLSPFSPAGNKADSKVGWAG